MLKKILHQSKQFVYRVDMFSTTANLRIGGQPQYQSLLGGCLSILLIGIFFGFFFNSLLQIIKRQNLSATSQFTQNLDPNSTIDGLQFAFGLGGQDLRGIGQRYFRFGVKSQVYINGSLRQDLSTQYSLDVCKNTAWGNKGGNNSNSTTSINGNAATIFDHYQIGNLLCLKSNQKVAMYGYQTSNNYSYLRLSISKCVNQTNDTRESCANQTQINNFFDDALNDSNSNYLTLNFYFLDNIINAQANQPVTVTVKDSIFLTFTPNFGMNGTVTFATYSISTDQSIWPFTSYSSESGYYIDTFDRFSFQVRNQDYAVLYLKRSTTQLDISRSYGKLDQMLSYIGGLFGLIFTVFYFFLGAYNEYCYELMIGQSLFKHKQTSKQENFNVIYYLVYQVYQYLNIFGCNPNWTRMRQIHQARQEATHQMDTRLIMKRLNYFQNVTQVLLEQHQKIALYLAQPASLQQMSKIRQIFQHSILLLTASAHQEDNSFFNLSSNRIIPQPNQLELGVQNMTELQQQNGHFLLKNSLKYILDQKKKDIVNQRIQKRLSKIAQQNIFTDKYHKDKYQMKIQNLSQGQNLNK